MPVGQNRIDPSSGKFLVQERRRAEYGLAGIGKSDPELPLHIGLEEKPAFVERAANDTDPFALEVRRGPDPRTRRKHQHADGPRVGDETESGSLAPLTRNPGPVRNDEIHGARLQRHLGGFIRGELNGRHGNPMLAVEAVMPDRIDFPGDCSKLEQPNFDRRMLLSP
jgi:hypothetical protein